MSSPTLSPKLSYTILTAEAFLDGSTSLTAPSLVASSEGLSWLWLCGVAIARDGVFQATVISVVVIGAEGYTYGFQDGGSANVASVLVNRAVMD